MSQAIATTKLVVTLALAVVLSACGGGSSSPATASPTQPSQTQPSPGSSAATTEWSVTQRFVSVTGPDNCWVRQQRAKLTGATFPDLPMSVTRSDGAITLKGSFFQVNYGGTFSGSEFTASGVSPLEGGGGSCDGVSHVQKAGVSNLSGQFSSDDQVLTATEANSYPLATGEQVTYTWAWQATRRN